MKIIELTAENVKRLKAVAIRPDGNLVEISGRNGQGKSSVLDAIWWALSGTSHIQAVPIRKGATEAIIRLDLGKLKVVRTFTKREDATFTTKLVVESEEGARFPSPQRMLDDLLGELSFGFVDIGDMARFWWSEHPPADGDVINFEGVLIQWTPLTPADPLDIGAVS